MQKSNVPHFNIGCHEKNGVLQFLKSNHYKKVAINLKNLATVEALVLAVLRTAVGTFRNLNSKVWASLNTKEVL